MKKAIYIIMFFLTIATYISAEDTAEPVNVSSVAPANSVLTLEDSQVVQNLELLEFYSLFEPLPDLDFDLLENLDVINNIQDAQGAGNSGGKNG